MSSLSNSRVATIGSGVMAEAIIAGLLRGKLVPPERIIGSEPRAERRDELAGQYGVRMVASNREAVRDADVILLSVKPQTLTKVGHELGGHLAPGQLVVSIVAGANCNVLTNLLDHRQVVRSMPNTPAQIGRGVTVWYATPEVSEEQCGKARALLQALGTDLKVEDERFVEMATAVSGTGPAYVFLVMEALIDAAVHLGFPRHVAHDLVIETLEGSTAFAKATAQHPAVLRNMVTSPGGTSAAAIHELESGRLRTVLSEAVWASYRRTVELGADLEKGLGLNEGEPDGSGTRRAGGATGSRKPTAGRGSAG
jgi:pyrroline-5-carboxylate reductase